MKSLSLVLLAFTLAACGSIQRSDMKGEGAGNNLITNTDFAPAAQGQVSTNMDSNGNTELNLKVKHLAKPEVLEQGAESYVVWVKPEGAEKFQNIGALNVDDNLEGDYSTKVPYDNFTLIVTAEGSKTTQNPSGPRVFKKHLNI